MLVQYSHQLIDENDISEVAKVLRSDFITQGPKVDEFEKAVANYCGARYAVAVSSGTAALHLACLVAGIQSDDEVLTTPLTFAATANSIIYCGGKPVFSDIDETYNIDPKHIEEKITRKTKAILPVDFAGHPCDLDGILDIAHRYHLIVIEDACHALGSEYNGHKIGSIADMTIFSFHPVKHITTGEGGMILTNEEYYYHRLKLLRHHGISNGQVCELGYNYRLTDFQCALGMSQLGKLDFFVARRREIANRYRDAIGGPVERPCVKHSYHIYVIQVDERDRLQESLRNQGINTVVHYQPLHLHPYYKQLGQGPFLQAENYYKRALTIPLYPSMTDEDVEKVIYACSGVKV